MEQRTLRDIMPRKPNLLYRVHEILKDGSARMPISKSEIAQKLSCPIRSLDRTLKCLKESYMAPLRFSKRKPSGYYYEEGENFDLPGIWFNKEELASLVCIRQIIKDFPQGVASKTLEQFWKRIEKVSFEEGQLPGNIWTKKLKVIPIAGREVSDLVFRFIVEAIVYDKRCIIQYKALGKESTKREISPLQLIRYKDNWYVDAWCHEKNGFREFALSRIKDIRMLPKKAVKKSKKSINNFFADAYGIFTGKADKKALILFKGIAAEEMSQEIWHPNQKVIASDENELRLEIPYSNDTELLMDIFRWGHLAEILEPNDLRNKAIKQLKKALESYNY
jgi:proteasome accessory factor C